MRIQVKVEYPWAGVSDDVEEIEIDNPNDLEEAVEETANEMVWNRVGYSYEILED